MSEIIFVFHMMVFHTNQKEQSTKIIQLQQPSYHKDPKTQIPDKTKLRKNSLTVDIVFTDLMRKTEKTLIVRPLCILFHEE